LRNSDLDQARQVSERDWLDLRLQVLGLKLTYPAYRVTLELTDSNRVAFVVWISTPMAKHLQESGRAETERLLGYHADGIQSRVGELLQSGFPALWADYDVSLDFGGEFMVPGEDVDTPPQRWARWQSGELIWDP
jgi:hypothetical protein